MLTNCFRKVFTNQVLEADLAAQCVTVGTGVAVDDNGIVFLYRVQCLLKHERLLSGLHLRSVAGILDMHCLAVKFNITF